MPDNERREALIADLAELDETQVLKTVSLLLDEGYDPLDIMQDCEQAMRLVGERYERREYYLSALIMAGEIFREVMMITQPFHGGEALWQFLREDLLGTVQGDIHDIGKGIVELALSCHGFTVKDLGIDVPPETFLEHVLKSPPDIIGLSGLVSVAYKSMQETVRILRGHDIYKKAPIPVIIGGSTLSEEVCRYVGADYWVTDAMEGVRICQNIMERKKGRNE